jgi:DNA invertase Pin-like site-specific DNA recombinase
MRYGYARVSTEDQSLEIQIADLGRSGCEDIRAEKISGATTETRQEFMKLMKILKSGDELWVVRIDRFARSMRDLVNVVDDLMKRGVVLKATQQPIDTSSASGRAFLQMLGVFAEFERSLAAERRSAGIIKAKADGKYEGCGRPKSISISPEVAKAKMAELGWERASGELRISKSALYRLAKLAA